MASDQYLKNNNWWQEHMKHTLPDSSSPRREHLGSQDSYIVITPWILDSLSLDLVAVLPWACRTLGPSLVTPSHQLSEPPCIHCASLAFSTCSRILYTKFLFLQVHVHNRNERTKSKLGCKSFGSSWNKKVNVHSATVRPATKPWTHSNTSMCHHLLPHQLVVCIRTAAALKGISTHVSTNNPKPSISCQKIW